MLGSTASVQTVGANNDQYIAYAMFGLVFQQASMGIVLTSLDGRIINANPALCRMLGYTVAELTTRTFRDITYLDDMPDSDELYQHLLKGKTGDPSRENRYLRKDGTIVWGHLVVALVRDPSGVPLYFVSMITDISDSIAGRKAAEDLEQAHARYRAILDNADEFIFVSNSEGILTYANSCVKLLGWSPEELVDKSLYEYVYPDDREAVKSTFERFLTGSDKRIHVRWRAYHKEERWVWVDSYAWAIPGPSGPRHEMAGILRDTSEYQREQTAFVEEIEQAHARRQAEEEAALTDQVTGLRNRLAADNMLVTRLTSVRASAFPVGCLLVDIDNFKQVNERYGQAGGDAVVKQLATVITESCRHDDFVARFSEEQFVVVLPGTNPGGTIICGEKLIRNIRDIDWSSTPLEEPVTVSIGATCIQYGSGLTFPELMGILDSQLEQAKESGRNRIVMNTRQISGKPQF